MRAEEPEVADESALVAGAAPELRVRLERQLARLGHGCSPEQSKPKEECHPPKDDSCDAADLSEVSSETEEEDEDGDEPIDYLMLSVASRLPGDEAAKLLERLRHHERRRARVEDKLRNEVRRLRKSRATSEVHKDEEVEGATCRNPQDSEAASASTARASACTDACADGVAAVVAARVSEPGAVSSQNEVATAADVQKPVLVAAAAQGGTLQETGKSSSRMCFLYEAAKLSWLRRTTVIIVALLAYVVPHLLPPRHRGSIQELAVAAVAEEVEGRVAGSKEGPRGTEVTDPVFGKLASDAASQEVVDTVSSLAELAKQRAHARAVELALEESRRVEIRRAMEIAAERLAAHDAAVPTAPSPEELLARRAALRDQVSAMEETGYRVLLRPPDDDSADVLPDAFALHGGLATIAATVDGGSA